ncbi:MAG: septum formation inhibitor Maf, partial [Bacteroidetes bacterium]|nr:septum formation inhibitor Maf [Bacteroidota bacterium]
MRFLILSLLAIPLLYSCETTPAISAEKASEFDTYWYKGKAELTSYHLEQARYGEIHQGHAVLIFVTEHFSNKDHVKTDKVNGNTSAVPILKMNATRKFNTGIYPYSLMTSAFTPVDVKEHPLPLKLSFSGQEWCGHAYSQLKLVDDQYQYNLHSYFEGEADKIDVFNAVMSEDGLMNCIRINPDMIRVGNHDLLPPLRHLRLLHLELKPQKATVSKEKKETTTVLSIDYEDIDRSVKIEYQIEFPHAVEGWTETYASG